MCLTYLFSRSENHKNIRPELGYVHFKNITYYTIRYGLQKRLTFFESRVYINVF
jgi:hypothetical protein